MNNIAKLVNAIPQIEQKWYLELGVAQRTTFDAVRAGSKVGVDIVGNGAEDIFEMTTDEFFAGLRPDVRFDVVFIDACHNYPQVLRDYNSAAIRCPDGAIFLHDMVPPSLEFTASGLCWDAYKLLGPLLQHPGHSVKVLDDDYGLTVVLNPQPVVPYEYWAQLSYEDFAAMPPLTVTLPEMMAVIANLYQGQT